MHGLLFFGQTRKNLIPYADKLLKVRSRQMQCCVPAVAVDHADCANGDVVPTDLVLFFERDVLAHRFIT